jgi:hypothetical protein
MLKLLACTLALMTACAAGLDTTPDTMPAHEQTVRLGGYLNEPATAARVDALLAGMQWEAVCSLGCTLYVQASRVDEAGRRLQAAIASEHLHATVDDALP